METPECFHILNVSGDIYHIDADTRREVEAFLRRASHEKDCLASITIESLAGEEVTVTAQAINTISYTSPETRAYYRKVCAMRDKEEAVG